MLELKWVGCSESGKKLNGCHYLVFSWVMTLGSIGSISAQCTLTVVDIWCKNVNRTRIHI
jgi:hypothetical protein